MPPYVCLPKVHPSAGSAYLGAPAAPFGVDADPNAPNFSVPDIVPPPSIAADRLENRQRILGELDRFQESAETKANRNAETVGVFQKKAFELMTSPAAKKAFDIRAESDKLRDAYGRNSLGQSCLMSRRLVEAGVRCVMVDHSNWDTHDGNFRVLKDTLLPQFDPAISTLFRDLSERGMLDSTLVLITGEFGRTPRINKNAGRDHWGPSPARCYWAVAASRAGWSSANPMRERRSPLATPTDREDLRPRHFSTLLGIDPEVASSTLLTAGQWRS